MICSNGANLTANGSSVSFTTGDRNTNVPMIKVTSPVNCSLVLTMTDNLGQVNTGSTTVQVGGSCSSVIVFQRPFDRVAACLVCAVAAIQGCATAGTQPAVHGSLGSAICLAPKDV